MSGNTKVVTAALMIWSCATGGAEGTPQGGTQAAQASALTQRVDVERLGLTIRYSPDWSVSQTRELIWLVKAPPEQATGPALDRVPQISVTTENRRDHADAVRRLREIASEYPGPVTYLTIGGWPALQRSVITDKEQPGDDDQATGAQEPSAIELVVQPNEKILKITTAIAAGTTLVRAEGRMPPGIGRATEDQVRAIES